MADNIEISLGVTGVNAATAVLRQFQSALAGIGTVANVTAGALLTMEAAFAGLVSKAITLADATGKAASKAGAGVEQFSALAKEAALADVSMEELTQSLRFFQREMVKQGRGNEDVVKTFVATVQAMEKIGDQAELTALQVQFFGKSGQNLNEFIKDSPTLLDRMNRSLAEGSVVTAEAAKAADDFHDNLTTLRQDIMFAAVAVATDILPKLVEWTKKIIDLERETGIFEGLMRGLLATTVAFVQGMRILFVVITQQVSAFEAARQAAASLISSYQGILQGVSAIAEAVGRAQTGDLKGAVLAAQLGILSLKGVAIDASLAVITFLEDNVTATQKAADQIEKIAGETQSFMDALFPESGGTLNVTKGVGGGTPLAGGADESGMSPFGASTFGLGSEAALANQLKIQLDQYREFFSKVAEMGKNTFNNLGTSLLNFSQDLLNTLSSGVGNALAAIATGSAKASDAFKALGKQMLGMLVSYFAQLILNTILFNTISAALRQVAFSAAIAQASALLAVNTASGVASAIASYGGSLSAGPLALAQITAAATIGAGLGSVFGVAGQAHGGLDSLPADATMFLSAGERVVQPEANTQLTEFLDSWESGGQRGGDIYLDGQKMGRILWNMSQDGQLAISQKAVVV